VTSAVKYLLDTDMCIYLLNGDEHVKSRVAQAGVEAIPVQKINLDKKNGLPYPYVRILD
jgi:hypothetical protein